MPAQVIYPHPNVIRVVRPREPVFNSLARFNFRIVAFQRLSYRYVGRASQRHHWTQPGSGSPQEHCTPPCHACTQYVGRASQRHHWTQPESGSPQEHCTPPCHACTQYVGRASQRHHWTQPESGSPQVHCTPLCPPCCESLEGAVSIESIMWSGGLTKHWSGSSQTNKSEHE